MNSNKKINLPILFFTVGAFFCTAVAIILRFVNITNFYDEGIGYYQQAALPLVMNVWFVVSVALLLIVNVTLEKKKLIPSFFASPLFFKVISGICAASIVATAVNYALHSTDLMLIALISLFALGSAAYFALLILKTTPAPNALLALSPAALSVVILAITYFDVYTQMNSPHKMLMHFAAVSCMLAFLAEARLISDKKKRSSYSFFILTALFFTGTSSIPAIILYFTNSFNYAYVDFDMIFLVFFLYFASRAITLFIGKETPDTESDEIKE